MQKSEQIYQLINNLETDRNLCSQLQQGENHSDFDADVVKIAVEIFLNPILKSQFLFTYFWSDDSL